MGNFELHVEKHSPHLGEHYHNPRHLTPKQLHHIREGDAHAGRRRFAMLTAGLFAAGFTLAGGIITFVTWLFF